MRAEIEFFRDNLKPNSGIKWETPIPHLIPQTPFTTTIGNSSLEGRWFLDCIGMLVAHLFSQQNHSAHAAF